MLPSLARAHTTKQGWERKLYWWINGILIFLSDLHKEPIVQVGVGGQNSPVIGQQSMKASLPAYSRDDNTSFLKGRWREVRIMQAYCPFAGLSLTRRVKSAWIIDVTVQFCLTGIFSLEGADRLARDARAEESLGYILRQEKLFTAASVSPRAAKSGSCEVGAVWVSVPGRVVNLGSGYKGRACVIKAYSCSQISLLHWTVALVLASLCKSEGSKQYCLWRLS